MPSVYFTPEPDPGFSGDKGVDAISHRIAWGACELDRAATKVTYTQIQQIYGTAGGKIALPEPRPVE